MKFKTTISTTEGDEHTIRGYALSELIAQSTFTDAIFLLYAKRRPTAGERSLLDALLVSAIEHGIEVPSLYVPRVSVASGNPVHIGIAAGILAIGEVHGGAGRAAAELFMRSESPESLVDEYVAAHRHLPGFGHKKYKDADPRATIIFEKAKGASVPLDSFEKAYVLEKILAEKTGKKLPLNIDGAFAAATLALALPPEAAEALFVLARVAGMGAHAIEEIEQKGSYHRLELEDVVR